MKKIIIKKVLKPMIGQKKRLHQQPHIFFILLHRQS